MGCFCPKKIESRKDQLAVLPPLKSKMVTSDQSLIAKNNHPKSVAPQSQSPANFKFPPTPFLAQAKRRSQLYGDLKPISSSEPSKITIAPQSHRLTSEFYALIPGKPFLQKTEQILRLYTPDKQIDLNCGFENLLLAMHIETGYPIETMAFDKDNLFVITETKLCTRVVLTCKSCQRDCKLSFSKALIDISEIECPFCDSKGSWSLQNIKSNFPLWADSQKIDEHTKMQDAPRLIRALGCTVCMKMKNCRPIPCGCVMCADCSKTGLQSCRFC